MCFKLEVQQCFICSDLKRTFFPWHYNNIYLIAGRQKFPRTVPHLVMQKQAGREEHKSVGEMRMKMAKEEENVKEKVVDKKIFHVELDS